MISIPFFLWPPNPMDSSSVVWIQTIMFIQSNPSNKLLLCIKKQNKIKNIETHTNLITHLTIEENDHKNIDYVSEFYLPVTIEAPILLHSQYIHYIHHVVHITTQYQDELVPFLLHSKSIVDTLQRVLQCLVRSESRRLDINSIPQNIPEIS